MSKRDLSKQASQPATATSCLEGEAWTSEEARQKQEYEAVSQDEELAFRPLAFDGVADVMIQAGHHKHNAWDTRTGAEGPLGREIDWTPVVRDEAARILEVAGVSVIRTDASIKTRKHEGPGKMFKSTLAIFIHFDGSSHEAGASIGYDHDSDRPAAEEWKRLYSRYWKFKWMPDNYTEGERHYYGFAHTVTTDAEMLLEFGNLENVEQARWLKPRLKWLGALLAHFLSVRLKKSEIPDPGPFKEPHF